MVEHGLEIEGPALEGVLRRVVGAVRARVAARFPEDQPVTRGEPGHVDVPHRGVAADAVGEHERRAAAVLLVVDADPVVGLEVWHGALSYSPPDSRLTASH